MQENKGKLIIALFSGLGNQMFQYAFYKHLLSVGFNAYLDKNSPLCRSSQKHESFRLDYFPLKEIKFATEKDIHEFLPKINNIYYKPFLEIIKTESVLTIIKIFFMKLKYRIQLKNRIWVEWNKNGRGKEFYRKDITKNTRAYMVGIYQEYYYLENICSCIRDDFLFDQNMPKSVKKYYLEIIGNNSVSIHVRRGDYSGAKAFDICTINYYRNAINSISKLVENPVYYLFSDDLEWVKTNFVFLREYTLIDNSEYVNSDYYDLYLMTVCKHNIIPNSTFSWWGAWLNQNPNKVVICPEKWSGIDFVLTGDICPPEWKREKVV